MRTNTRTGRINDTARRKALADAAAGVIGSLASVLAFYPVDVWKTSLQAGVTTATTSRRDDATGDHASIRSVLSRSFRGLPYKVAHTVVSSFTYFFVYSLVQTKYAARRRAKLSNGNDGSASGAATKLLLTAFAAVINTCITLPLDTVSSRKQAGATEGHQSKQSDQSNQSNQSNQSKQNDQRNQSAAADEEGWKADPSSMPSRAEKANGISTSEGDDGSASGDDVGGEGFASARCSSSEEYHSAYEEEGEEDDNGRGPARDDEMTGLEPSGARGRNAATTDETDGTGGTDGAALSRKERRLYIKTPEKYQFSFSTDLAREAFATTDGGDADRSAERRRRPRSARSIPSLWNGLFPSILLCTNPAIQYTMYDALKGALLQHRRRMREHGGNDADRPGDELSMWEAFAFGIVSKFVATVATYPLIRCKVMLMVSSPEAFGAEGGGSDRTRDVGCERRAGEGGRGDGGDDGNSDDGTHGDDGDERRTATRRRPSSRESNGERPPSLPSLLVRIFRKDGMRGVYKGCSLQLLHTVLKSAMLMMVRERITYASRRFFRVEDGSS